MYDMTHHGASREETWDQEDATERIAFVLIDGLADIQIPALGSLTPLEAADTPTMDAVAGEMPKCLNRCLV